jgi:DNA-binding MarR family transcriptional regulator
MVVYWQSSPFGSPARTRVLLATQLLGDSYARELARVLAMNLSRVQKALQSLERDGLLVARSVGRTRVFALSPRTPARRALMQYLDELARLDPELQERVGGVRRRPRGTAKP